MGDVRLLNGVGPSAGGAVTARAAGHQASPPDPTDSFQFSQTTLAPPGGPPARDPRDTMAAGRPYGVETAAALERAYGCPMTRDGLHELYRNVVPGAQLFVNEPNVWPDGRVQTRFSWRDREGREVAHYLSLVGRDDAGAMEIHRMDIFVDPQWRGRAVTARLALQELSLLQSQSDHPRSRITLHAGKSQGEDGTKEKVGTYHWARQGFTFGRESNLLAMREAYATYVGGDAGESQSWTRPSQFAAGELGKQFMLSAAPEWRAELYPSDPQSLGEALSNALQAIQRARGGPDEIVMRHRLQHGSPDEVRQTLVQLEREGPCDLLPLVEAWHDHPELGTLAARASAALRGEGLIEGLEARARDPQRDPMLRISDASCLAQLRGYETFSNVAHLFPDLLDVPDGPRQPLEHDLGRRFQVIQERYMSGLKQRAVNALGDRFDEEAYRRTIVTIGSRDRAALEAAVERFIAQFRPPA